MNWPVFAIFTYLFFAVQLGFAPLLELDLASQVEPAVPHLVLLLAVFVGLYASNASVMIAWTAIGLLMDLTTVYDGGLTLIGPYTLGYIAGGYVMLQMRSMVFKHHPMTTGFLIFVCGMAVQLIVVLIFTIRGFYDPLPGWSAISQLSIRLLILGYSAVLGAFGAIVMLRLTPLFGFLPGKRQRNYMRHR